MAVDSPFAQSNALIAGRYAVDTSQSLPDAGGGLPAYLVRDQIAGDAKRIAVSVSRAASPRMQHLNAFSEPIDHLMGPLGHGVAALPGGRGEGYFVVCEAPPGPPLSAILNPWPDRALIDLVLRPVADVLNALHGRRLTHRAIRPNNVFQAAPGQPVTLGSAWAAPPAMHQPAVFESPYSVMCHPACRGDGMITDDVYALGVLLLTLSGGKVPMAGMDDATVIRWKLDLGSFAALTRDSSLSGLLADLLRGMLAEDPDHRPLPGMLMDLVLSRGRRVAAHPGRRSQNPLMLNDIAVFDARTLAWGLLSDEKKAIQFLRNGLVTQWLRRWLGDASLAAEIEELIRGRQADTRAGPASDALLVMNTISALNPRMPLCWRGIALWPDALGTMLAEGVASNPDMQAAVEELLAADIISLWDAAQSKPGRADPADLLKQRRLLQVGGPDALLRLFYQLNVLLPCRVPAMTTAWIANMADLMRFFDRTAATAGDNLIDRHISAFIAARADRKIDLQVTGLGAIKDANMFRMAELAFLRDMQERYHPAPMPGLAKWVAAKLRPDLDKWRNKPRREAMQARLEVLANAGAVSRLLEMADDPAGRALDLAGAAQAAGELAVIDAELGSIDHDDRLRFTTAEQFGQAIAGGIGLSALILMAMSVVLR